MSHDPPAPEIASAQGETREHLIAGRNPSSEARLAGQASLITVAKEADQGRAPAKPLNPEWDKAFIDLIRENRLAEVDHFTEEGVREHAGRGGNEVLAWVAAVAALAASGPYDAHLEYCKPIHGWIAGVAIMTAINH